MDCMEKSRKAAVAGSFYPIQDLKEMIAGLFTGLPVTEAKEMIGIVVPHAGYVYSGKTAAHAYAELKNSNLRDFVVLGPDHYGVSDSESIYAEGTWSTPLGNAKIDEVLARSLLQDSEDIVEDEAAHSHEHSIEVQIPFLQYLFGETFSFVPVQLSDQSIEAAKRLALQLYGLKKKFITIASSDLTHYEPQKAVLDKDMKLINSIEALDTDEFYDILIKDDVSACGYGAVATLMELTKLRKGKIKLLKHSTSGDVTEDKDSVVGYGALVAYI